jgi:hypothetical protein
MDTRLLATGLILVSGMMVCRARGQASEGDRNKLPTATVSVESVRITRSSPELRNKFGGRMYSETSPGVNLQLLVKLDGGALLAPARDSIRVETFLDDTYQSLMDGQNAYYNGGQRPLVSEDGKCMVFSVSSSRQLAEDAERLFVRGRCEMQMISGQPIVKTAQFPLQVGSAVEIGPFATKLQGIMDAGDGGFHLTLSILGPSGRLLKVRALKAGDPSDVVSDPLQSRINDSSMPRGIEASIPFSCTVKLRKGIKDAVMLEFTYGEKLENVIIPFEAQVDLAGVKGGQVSRKVIKRPTAADGSIWPPPSTETNKWPSRRAPFTPTNAPVRAKPR